MYFVESTRNSLLEYLLSGGENLLFGHQLGNPNELEPPAEGRFWAAFTESDERVPVALFMGEEEIDGFLAWAATYLTSFSPFTSLIRVLPWRNHRLIIDGISPRFNSLDAASVGSILGEILSFASSRTTLDSLSISSFNSTISFSLARALSFGWSLIELDEIATSIGAARALGVQSDRSPVQSVHVQSLWRILYQAASNNQTRAYIIDGIDPLVLAASELMLSKSVSRQSIERVSRLVPLPYDVYQTLSQPKENQVRVFFDGIQAIQPESQESASFIAGYLLALLSSGSLSHYEMLTPLISKYPSSLLWYGTCTGLLFPDQLLSWAGGLGRRILRDILAPSSAFSRPSSDLSLSELKVLVRYQGKSRPIRQFSPTSLAVELLPGIATQVRLTARNTSQTLDTSERVQDNERSINIRPTSQMDSSVNELRKIVDELKTLIYPSVPYLNKAPRGKKGKS